jgi:hypothetical protein
MIFVLRRPFRRPPTRTIVSKSARPAEIGYWRDRRVVAIGWTFQEFLEALDQQLSKNLGVLAALAVDASNYSTFTRFITTPGSYESDDLKHYLASFIEDVGPEINPPVDNAQRFYSGFDLGWYPMAAELDVRQLIVDEIITERVLARPATGRPSLIVIKGHAGSGKSVVLRRVCFEATVKHNRLYFFVSRPTSNPIGWVRRNLRTYKPSSFSFR